MFGSLEEGKIYIFYGKMGSGKTTNAIRQLFTYHRASKPVWLNFPILDYPRGKKGEPHAPIFYEADPAGILAMRGGLFIIDEAYLTLNSREWANLPKAVFTAFTHVRKLHMTVVVIAQSWMRIDKSIREVASYAREFRGGSFFGRLYNYTEYEVDEMGEIVKGEPVEYRSALRGLTIIRKPMYDIFDTDYLFNQDDLNRKAWPSAVGWGAPTLRSGRPDPTATVQPTPLRRGRGPVPGSGEGPGSSVLPGSGGSLPRERHTCQDRLGAPVGDEKVSTRGGLDPVWTW